MADTTRLSGAGGLAMIAHRMRSYLRCGASLIPGKPTPKLRSALS
jgi:hypothetical protein